MGSKSRGNAHSKKRNPRRYKDGDCWSSRKPIHVSQRMHREASLLASLGLPVGKNLGEVVESGIQLLLVKYRKEIKQRLPGKPEERLMHEGQSLQATPLVNDCCVFHGD